MSTKWVVKDNYVMIEREGQLPLLHSVMLDKNRGEALSYSYWDYEAWIMSKYVKKKILVLGLGGATSLQILDNLGITPSEIIGVDIDADELREKGILNYSYLTIVNADAYSYLNKTEDMYDLIIVDVYGFNGYVENVYKDVRLLKSKLTSNGSLAFHCLDPIIKYYTFDIKFDNKCPSTSYEIASNIDKHFENIYILPLWTASLVLASDTDVCQVYKETFDLELDMDPSYVWLDKFFRSRLMKFENFNSNFTRFERNLEYGNIEAEDRLKLISLYRSLKDRSFVKTFHEVFGEINQQEIADNNIMVDADHQHLKSFFLLCEFMTIKDSETSAGRVENILKELKTLDIKVSSIVRSFIFAYGKQWDKALEVLS